MNKQNICHTPFWQILKIAQHAVAVAILPDSSTEADLPDQQLWQHRYYSHP